MRIGIVSDYYSPSIGGTQNLAQSLCEGLMESGHEIEVITSIDPERNHEEYNYKINESSALNFTQSDFLLNQNYDSLIVLADLFSPTLSTINAGDTRNSILILNLDENVYNWINQGRFTNLEQIIKKIKSYSHVVSFCKGAPINKFLEENKIKYTFIPNFTRDVKKTEKPSMDIRSILKMGNKKIIFNHGNFETRKNQLYLVNQFASSNLRKEYNLVLLGSARTTSDEFYLSEVKRLIRTLELSECVKIVKGTRKKEIIDLLLNSSDIYVLPSKAEGLPLVLLEAMSAGLPWISTPVGGVPEVLGSLRGGIVLPQVDFTAYDLETAVRSVQNGFSRQEWEDNFTKEISITRYKDLLNV